MDDYLPAVTSISILVLMSIGAVLSGGLFWGYALLVTPLVYKKHYAAATGLLVVAFVQTLEWPFWLSLALVFNLGLEKD